MNCTGLWCRFVSGLMVGAILASSMPGKAFGPQEAARGEAHVRNDLAQQTLAAEAAVRTHPEDPDALFRLVVLYDRGAEFKKSIPLLEKLMLIRPDNPDVYRRLGIDRFHTGQPGEALEPLRTVVHASPEDMEANFYLGLCYVALDREDEANKVFDRQAAMAPADADELYLLVRGYSHLSSSMLSRLAGLGGDSYRMHQVRGEYFDLENNPELAIKEYAKAVQLRPDLPSLHYVLGTACWKHSELDKAAAEFRRTIELAPQHFMAHYNLGMVLLEQNAPAEAMKEFQVAIAVQPGISNGYLGLGKALYQQGQYEAALPQLQRYAELSPDNPEPHYLLFQIFRRLNNNEEAEKQLALFKQKDEKAKAKNAAKVTPPRN
jgi:tetratricopeptide (TPR) repeat protein